MSPFTILVKLRCIKRQQCLIIHSHQYTIQSQVDNGDFDDIASVHYAEAKMNKKGAQASAENNNNGSVGLIGGVFVAVAAAVALVVTGFVKKKGNSWNGCCGPAAVLPANNRGVLVDVLSEDVEDLWRLR